MSVVWQVVAGLAGLALGFAAGWRLGRRLEGKTARFWIWAIVLFVACTAAAVAAHTNGLRALGVACLGALAGVLSGMKYGSSPDLRRIVSTRGPEAR